MRIYPDIIFSAEKNRISVSAFRVWFLAKAFCRAGATVPVGLFKAWLAGLGVKKSTYYRWIAEALDLGLLQIIKSENTGLSYYKLASWFDGARIAGCKSLANPIEMPVESLLITSWRAEVWAGRLLQVRDRTTVTAKISRDHNGEAQLEKKIKRAKPISRRTLEKVTGVKRRTQQNREKKAKVRQQQHVLIHEGKRGGFQPYGSIDEQPGLMVTSGGVAVEQLPNSREIPDHFQKSSRSRTRKVNKSLKALCERGAIAKDKADISLRYIDTLQQGKAILKHNPGVTILSYAGYAGQVLSGAMGWKVFNYGL